MLGSQIRDDCQIVLRQQSSGRVLRRVDNDQLGSGRDFGLKLLGIETELELLQQGQGDRGAPAKADHGFVDGESRVRKDDFVAFLHQSQDQKKHDGLGSRRDDDPVRINVYRASFPHVVGNGFSQFHQAG